MSITGEPNGEPMKVGVGIADVMCGMYAATAVLAALRSRDRTGAGQHIDLALLDAQVAWLVNEGLNYLTSGAVPKRIGNEHPNIVPYKVLPCADGYVIIAVGNDRQFRRFCGFAGAPELADDPRFRTNSDRVRNRQALYAILPDLTMKKTRTDWVDGLIALGVPVGPVNSIDQVFEDPQVRTRGMKLEMSYPGAAGDRVDLVANPIKFSETPVTYRRPPPTLGQHTNEVLQELLGLGEGEMTALRDSGVI
jgi:crotonobetainyl-CoA:carnitine CoA-transferase CaiB-like acyl-CoA transferase